MSLVLFDISEAETVQVLIVPRVDPAGKTLLEITKNTRAVGHLSLMQSDTALAK